MSKSHRASDGHAPGTLLEEIVSTVKVDHAIFEGNFPLALDACDLAH